MIANLKLINPLQENELFSVHKIKKNNRNDFSFHNFLNKTYKPYIIQKNCLTSLKKEIISDKNNKTFYSFKNNNMSHIPYPSFPKNNKMPLFYRNINKKLKYPKISNNNKNNLYNTYNNFNKNKKIILLNNNSKSRLNSDSNKIDNNRNKLVNFDNNGFISLNSFFNNYNQ